MIIEYTFTVVGVIIGLVFALLLWRVAQLIKNVNKEVVPILQKSQKTLDEINIELKRVDGITKAAEEVVDKVNNTTRIAQEAISSPLIKLVSISAGLKKAVSTLRKGE